MAGGFTGGSTQEMSNKSAQGKKGVSFDAIRLERQNYDSTRSWVLQPETFQNNVAASVSNTVSDGVEFVGNFFSSEGRKEDLRRSLNVVEGAAKTMVAFDIYSHNDLDSWNSFFKPILTSPQTYEELAAGWALGYGAEGALSVAVKIPKINIGFARDQNVYLFRGTFDGAEGLSSLQRLGITPTTPNPAKATIFATESERLGDGVVHIASKKNLKGVLKTDGNVLAHLEEEVALDILPKDFAKRAGITITSEQSREILKTMGINSPKKVSISNLSELVRTAPIMTPQQISQYIKEAKAIMKQTQVKR